MQIGGRGDRHACRGGGLARVTSPRATKSGPCVARRPGADRSAGPAAMASEHVERRIMAAFAVILVNKEKPRESVGWTWPCPAPSSAHRLPRTILDRGEPRKRTARARHGPQRRLLLPLSRPPSHTLHYTTLLNGCMHGHTALSVFPSTAAAAAAAVSA